MSAFGYAWSLPITWQRWRSQHSIRKPHARPPKAFLRNRLKSVKVPPLCTRRPYNINSCELWLLVNYVQITIQSMSALFGRSVHQLSTLSLSFHCNGEIIVIFFAWNSGPLNSGPLDLPTLPTHCYATGTGTGDKITHSSKTQKNAKKLALAKTNIELYKTMV